MVFSFDFQFPSLIENLSFSYLSRLLSFPLSPLSDIQYTLVKIHLSTLLCTGRWYLPGFFLSLLYTLVNVCTYVSLLWLFFSTSCLLYIMLVQLHILRYTLAAFDFLTPPSLIWFSSDKYPVFFYVFPPSLMNMISEPKRNDWYLTSLNTLIFFTLSLSLSLSYLAAPTLMLFLFLTLIFHLILQF